MRAITKFSFSIDSLMSWMCLAWIPIFIVTYFVLGRGPSTDATSVLLMSLLSLILGGMVHSVRGSRTAPLAWTLVVVAQLHVFPRFWEYLAVTKLSRRLMFVLFPIEWTTVGLNQSLSYVVAGTIAMWAGLYIAKRWLEPWLVADKGVDRESALVRSPWAVVIVFLLASAIDAYFNWYVGLSAASNCFPDVSMKWLIHLFSSDTSALIISFLVVNNRSSISRSWLTIFLVLIGLYLAYTVGTGSRVGILRVLLLVFFSYVAANRSPRLAPGRMFLPLVVAGVMAVASFAVATRIRSQNSVSCSTQANSQPPEPSASVVVAAPVTGVDEMTDSELDDPSKATSYNASWLTKPNEHNQNKVRLPSSFQKVLDRLGVIDYPLAFPMMKLDQSVVRERFSISYVFRSFVNSITPGTPFPGADITTARLHPMLFRDKNEAHLRTYYLSEIFTIWGLAYIHFGMFGGIVACGLSMFLVCALWLGLDKAAHSRRFRSIESRIFLALFLWGFVLGGFYLTQGLDYSGMIILYFVIQVSIFFVLVRVLDRFAFALKRNSSS